MTPSEEWSRLTLLEKLRKLELGMFQPGLYADAADEIERLRAERDEARDALPTIQLNRWRLFRTAARNAALEEAALAAEGICHTVDCDCQDRCLTAESAAAIRALKAQHVVHSAPQSTMEGFFAMGDPEKTDLAVEIANLVGKAIEQGADVEEVKAVLNEVLDELEAQGDGEDEPPKEDGENA